MLEKGLFDERGVVGGCEDGQQGSWSIFFHLDGGAEYIQSAGGPESIDGETDLFR